MIDRGDPCDQGVIVISLWMCVCVCVRASLIGKIAVQVMGVVILITRLALVIG